MILQRGGGGQMTSKSAVNFFQAFYDISAQEKKRWRKSQKNGSFGTPYPVTCRPVSQDIATGEKVGYPVDFTVSFVHSLAVFLRDTRANFQDFSLFSTKISTKLGKRFEKSESDKNLVFYKKLSKGLKAKIFSHFRVSEG